MAILTAGKLINAVQGGTSHGTPQFWHYPHAASNSFQGSIMMLDITTGFVKVCPLAAAGTSAGIHKVVGILRGSYLKGSGPKPDSSDCANSGGAAGDRVAIIEAGIFPLTNDTTAGAALGDEFFGLDCFAMDDNNVSANPLNYNRPYVGKFMGLNASAQAMVSIDPFRPHPAMLLQTALANAALATAFTAVKIASDSGVGEFAAQATDTGLFSGILLNTPDGVTKMAKVCTGGPCPALAGAAGFVCGTELMVTTSGALIAATAAKVVVAVALETATNGQIRMVDVKPRQLAA